jgi:hypothetical protein
LDSHFKRRHSDPVGGIDNSGMSIQSEIHNPQFEDSEVLK